MKTKFKSLCDLLAAKQTPPKENASLSLRQWEHIIHMSLYHGVAPLLFKRHQDIIPQELKNAFEKNYFATLKKNMFFWREFTHLLQRFKENNIDVIALKGIVFADLLYQDIGLRPMDDIDVLIRKSDLQKAGSLMTKLGYIPALHKRPISYWLTYLHHISFVNKKKSLNFEIHWAFCPPRPQAIDVTPLWERIQQHTIENIAVKTLSVEDTLLSLTAEICKIVQNLQYIRLKNLYDFELLIHQYSNDLNVDYVLKTAQEWNLNRSLYFIIQLTQELLKTAWPPMLINKLPISGFEKKIIAYVPTTLKPRSRLRSYLLLFLLTDGIKAKAQLSLQRIQSLYCLFLDFVRRSLKTQ